MCSEYNSRVASEPVIRNELPILIVDDDPAVRLSLQLLLKAKGYSVQDFPSADALLKAFDDTESDCLFVDYQMPDMDGLELVRRLRAEGWTGWAYLLTASADPQLESRSAEAGIDLVVEKPISVARLLDLVHLARVRIRNLP